MKKGGGYMARILVFSTNNISDPGIDLCGSNHMDYPLGVSVISVPCSSGIDPRWILYALEQGFDGVFVAADGTDCSYLQDCTTRTGKVIREAQELAKGAGLDPRRIKMAAICSVCSEAFQNHMKKFDQALEKLRGEGNED